MSHGAHAVVLAVIEAKKKKQEEREMTNYTDQELGQNWEFKIMRSATGLFSKREKVEQIIAEESLAGWMLAEKFDDNRLRFKRPASAKRKDYNLPAHINPYRTNIGMNEIELGFTLFGIMSGIAALIGIIFSLFE
jgi:hypothetical protein